MRRELIAGAVALGCGVAVALLARDAVERYDLRPASEAVVAPSSAASSAPGQGSGDPREPTGKPAESSKQTKDPQKPKKGKAPKPPKKTQEMTVTWVYDGDTIQVQAKRPGRFVNINAKVDVRLIGVDAPELKPKAECYGKKATTFLKNLLPVGSKVLVAPDKDSWDDFKRRLFYVWTKNGKDLVSYEIARTGHAAAIRIWPNVMHYDVLKSAQESALKAKRGLWGKC